MYRLLTLALLITACVVPASAGTWDLFGDFSAATNPHGAWTYGTTASVAAPGYTVAAFTHNAYNGWGDPTEEVLMLDGVIFGGDAAGKIAMSTGQVGSAIAVFVVRWTAPEAGVYDVTASFAQLPNRDDLRGDVNLYVLANGTAVYSEFKPDNYNEPAGFGYEPYTYSGQVTLGAGDTIDWAVDPATWYGRDWMTLEATVTTVPEPSSILALVAGMGGFIGLLRKRA